MTDWANFSNTAAQEGDDRIADNAVGDWGNDEDDDFGGFETADPPEVASQAVQLASPSPWASFPPTVASPGQPDLLQAQSLPQPSACSLDSDPIFVNKVSSVFSETSHDNPPEITSQVLPPEMPTEVLGACGFAEPEITSLARIRETPPPELTTEADAAFHNANKNNVLEEFRLSDEDLLPTFVAGKLPNKPDTFSLDDFEIPLPSTRSSEEFTSKEKTVSVQPSISTTTQTTPEYKASDELHKKFEEKLTASENEKERLKKELEDLRERNAAMEREMKDTQLAAAEQQKVYEEMQNRHCKVLEDVKRAGHDTLVVIVEEYKELCKVVVAQQTEASEKQLQTAVQRETETSKTMLRAQHERLMKVVDEERLQGEKRLKEILSGEQEKSQALVKQCVLEEREKIQEAIQKTVEVANRLNHTQLEMTLQEERQSTKQLLEEERNRSSKLLEEERQRSKETLETMLEEERQRSREAIQSALEKEREKQETRILQVVEKTKEDIKQYVQEQKQADTALRLRSLTSMDLFLESTRQQLKLLYMQEHSKESDGGPP